MKRVNGITICVVITLLVLSCVCCACQKESDKDDDYSGYIGKQYKGKDPWGNPLTIDLKSMEGEEVTFGYEGVIGEDDYTSTFLAEASGELKDGKIPFHITSTAKENDAMHMEYSGSLTLKDGAVLVTYDDGQVNEESTEGGSASYQVPALDENSKTVELKN